MPPKKAPRAQRSRKASRSRGGPRRLNHVKESLEEVNKPREESCRYCHTVFSCHEFCEDHEQDCQEGPLKPKPEVDNFMAAMGLQPQKAATEATVDHNFAQPAPVVKTNRCDAKIMMKIFTKNPLPITTTIGKNLVSTHGGEVTHEDTLRRNQYEKFCRTDCIPHESVLNNSIVTKRKIFKNSDECHEYTNPRSRHQRITRYQELVLGYKITKEHKKYSCKDKTAKTCSGIASSPNAANGSFQRKKSKRIAQKHTVLGLEAVKVTSKSTRQRKVVEKVRASIPLSLKVPDGGEFSSDSSAEAVVAGGGCSTITAFRQRQ